MLPCFFELLTFKSLPLSGGSSFAPFAIDEDPRTSALQRQLSEVDAWLKGQAHKLATAEEALAVQELDKAMLAGQA